MTKEELINYIKILKTELKNNKYGLYWDKKIKVEDVVKKTVTEIPIFEKKTEYSLESKEKANLTNLLIEGDNFQALTTLNMIYGNEVIDFIYIDPPYNTGNEDFVYNDKMIDKDDGYRHSKWLNFMEKRLLLAHKLLKDDGIICISIDYHSVFQLKLLMDKIFGENQFISDLVIETGNANGPKTTHRHKKIFKVKEYVLVYAKNMEFLTINPSYEAVEDYDLEYNIIFYKNKRYTLNNFKSKYNFTMKEVLEKIEKKEIVAFRSMRDFGTQTKRHINKINDYELLFKYSNNHGDYEVRKTTTNSGNDLYLRYNKTNNRIDMLSNKLDKVKDGKVLKLRGDLWKGYNKEYGNVEKEGGVKFKNGKKSLKFVKDLISLHPKKNITVLDFFAGSGTTGEAVLQLNQEDGGARKFILVTNNEISPKEEYDFLKKLGYTKKLKISKDSSNKEVDNKLNEYFGDKRKELIKLHYDEYLSRGIARGITLKRMNNVYKGYGKIDGIEFNLEYFIVKTIKKSANIEQNKYNLVLHGNHLLCILENTHKLIKNKKQYFIYRNNEDTKRIFIYADYYKKEIYDEFLNEIINTDDSINKVIYIYTPNNNLNNEHKINVVNGSFKPIPQKIFDIYKNILKEVEV